MKMKMEGKKSHLVELRELEDKIRSIKLPEGMELEAGIFEYAQKEADRILEMLKIALSSYKSLGRLTNVAVSVTHDSWKKDMSDLARIPSGIRDAEIIKNIIEEYTA